MVDHESSRRRARRASSTRQSDRKNRRFAKRETTRRAMRLELLERRELLANDLQIDLQLFDTMNQPISGPVAPGTEIVLEATIRDIRANAVGVASAYLDLTFPGQTSLVAGSVTHGADYNFDPSNGVLNGSTIEDIGAADTDLTPPAAAQAAADYLLFSIHFTANTVGIGNFSVAVGNNALLLTRMFPETGFITVAPDMVVVNGATLEVAAANNAPVANDQTINTNEDTAAGVTLTGTDTDSDPLTFTVITQPANGALTGTAPNLTYTPDANFNGTDSFTFIANDGTADSNTGTISLSIAAVNDAPVASGQSLNTNEDVAAAVTLGATDVENDSLSFTIVTQPANGTLSGTAPNLTYTPDANFNGTDSFTFIADDGTADSNTATISLSITAVNDAPVASGQSLNTNEDVATAVTLGATDVENDALTFTIVAQPANGTLSGTAPNLTYTPDADFNGSDSFTFIANDGTTDSNTATISLSIAAVNDAPVANAQSLNVVEDMTRNVTLTGSDVENDSLTFTVLTQPANGTLTGTVPNLTYTPNANYTGPDSFTFRVNDGALDSNVATISLNVTADNQPPVASNATATTDEDTAVGITLAATDQDSDSLTFTVAAQPANGTLSGVAPNLTYTPDANFNGTDSFTFVANDSMANSNTATISITVSAVNDLPVASDQNVTATEDVAVMVTLAATDVENDALTFTILTLPGNGTLTGAAPNLTYTPDANFNGDDSFTFVANDGSGDSNTATVSFAVSAVNDAPAANSQTANTDEDTPVAITMSASDVENDPLTFTVTGQPTNGTLSGTSPNLTYTPDANFNGVDSFTYVASDGTADSATATITVSVAAVNDPPTATNQSVSTNEDTAVAVSLSGTDVENDALTFTVIDSPTSGTLSGVAPNLTYTPDANFNGPDSFTFVANDGSADSATGTITINVTAVNDAPVADSQTLPAAQGVSRTVTLTADDVDNDPLSYSVLTQPANGTLTGTAPNLVYTPNAGFTGADSLTFLVNDGTVDSNTATISFDVRSTNDPPVANAQTVSATEDVTVFLALSGSDPDSDPLTFEIVTPPANGTVSGPLNSSGANRSYTPAAHFSGVDTFTFRVSDGMANSAEATVTISVAAVNDAPAAASQTVTTNEDNAVAVTLGATDVENDPLTFTVTTQPTSGTLSGVAPNLTYTPDSNFNGVDTFTFVANDGTVDSSTATIMISVSAVNDAPIAADDAVNTDEDTAVTIALTATDVDNDPLTFTIASQPTSGTLSGTGPSFVYTPNANASGVDTFTYTVNDGTTDSNTATVSITIAAVNDPPVASDSDLSVDEDATLAVSLQATDVESDPLTFTLLTQPANGTLSGTAPNLTYTPDPNFSGTDSFTFVANDGAADSNTATVSITVNAINDLPVAADNSVNTDEDTSATITLTVTDADNDPLTFEIASQPTNGTLSGNGPTFVYTPAANFSGQDSFTYLANDGSGNSNTATVSISIAAVDDPPVADGGVRNLNEDTPLNFTLTGSDPENATLTFTVVTQPTNGTVTGTAPNLTYTPNANFNGTDTLTFRVNDGGQDSAIATITFSVAAVNDPPVATPLTITTAEDTAASITLAGTDPDNNTLTFAVLTQPAHGTLTGSGANLTYTPNTNFNGSDSFTYRVNDGTVNSAAATVSITVTGENDAPSVVTKSVTVVEDTATAFTLEGSDPEASALTFTIVTQPSSGTVTGTAPNLTYTPAANFNGTTTLTYRANDGQLNSPLGTITFSVTAVNDAPVANAVTRTTNEDTAVSVTLSGTDVENSTLSFTVLTQPANGTLSGTAPNLTYTPAANFNGTDTFTYRVSDGSANSNTATVSLTVTAVNDAPSFTLAGNPPASNPGAGLQTVANFATNISRGAANESSQTLTFNVTQLSNSGITFTTPPTINATTGALTYAVAANSSGTARFGVTLSDNGSGTSPNVNTSAQQTFEITVGLSTLSGSVFIDSDNDGVRDTGEIGLPNVTITLQGTSTGNTSIQRTTTTGNDGTYQFTDLPPGTYSVTETHPSMFLDGVERVGTAGGTAGSDQITGIVLSGNTNAQNYNFTERGLTASAVGLKMFLCSTPSGDVFVHQLLSAAAGNGNALRAASLSAANARGTSNAVVTAASVEPLVQAAIQQFADAGASAEQLAKLSSAQVRIVDLPGDRIGEASGNAITLDVNAAGLGWFIDATPTVDEEFLNAGGRMQATADSDAAGRLDALTAIAHEFGHLLGFEHPAGDEDSLMFEWLQTGQRKRITLESLDDLFANNQAWDW